VAAEKDEVDLLIAGLKDENTAEKCAEHLADLACNKPELFKQEHVDSLAAVLKSESRAVWQCSKALNFLARKNAKLAERCIDALIAGLGCEKSAKDCKPSLGLLAVVKEPEMFTKKHADALVAGLKNEKTAQAYASVLESLTGNKPGLFTKEHVDCLVAGLGDSKIEPWCRCALANLGKEPG